MLTKTSLAWRGALVILMILCTGLATLVPLHPVAAASLAQSGDPNDPNQPPPPGGGDPEDPEGQPPPGGGPGDPSSQPPPGGGPWDPNQQPPGRSPGHKGWWQPFPPNWWPYGSGGPLYKNTRIRLPLEEADGLVSALRAEYRALDLYQAAWDQFGNISPFKQIIPEEQQHIDTLLNLASRYNVPVPVDLGLVNTPYFASRAAACQAGVKAENYIIQVYEEIQDVTRHSDLLKAYLKLQKVARNNHLAAFRSCRGSN